ncbi:hypothetical protein DPX16_8916 [Anabarilius grahami]|uniref:Uncharacterized protein n=1 Tax=Anabarilius grahami TaxID=495550 RepID=A0A3N0ZA25_ANAGA|nr:hypothetical protein DPX16_8916 [Anabarilius grahami]
MNTESCSNIAWATTQYSYPYLREPRLLRALVLNECGLRGGAGKRRAQRFGILKPTPVKICYFREISSVYSPDKSRGGVSFSEMHRKLASHRIAGYQQGMQPNQLAAECSNQLLAECWSVSSIPDVDN